MNCYKCQTPLPDNSRFCSTCGADVSGDSHAHTSDATLVSDQDPQLFAKLQEELGSEYILERELGRGGMAVVYLGRDAHLNRKVAVKVLPPELTYGGKGSMIERFKREAQTAAKLDHPNIIPVYRVAPGGTLFWYVMKYLDGEPLDHILEREGPLSVERTVAIVSQVAEALDYAHQNQVVHRDVKPANVVVDKRGRVTVTDFGIAKALDANTLTASGSIIGTPFYMSPEQCKGKRVGPAADQYSLAVMTYQMLAGHLPFTGESAVEIVHKHVADPVPPLGVLRPQLPTKVVQVVERGLAKDPDGRFPTVADFARTLKATAEGLDVTIAPPSKPAGVRSSKTAVITPAPGAPRAAKERPRRRTRQIIDAGALIVVVAIAVALYVRKTAVPTVSRPTDTLSVLHVAAAPAVIQAPAKPVAESAAAPPVRTPVAPPPSRAARRQAGAASRPAAGKQPAQQPTLPVTQQAQRQVAAPSAGLPQAPPSAPAKQEAPAPTAAQPAPPPAAAQAESARPAVGYITVGTRPVSTIYINGTARGPRLVNVEVPAGTVRLRFQVQDSTGIWWARDLDVTVAAGEHKMLSYLTLVRP